MLNLTCYVNLSWEPTIHICMRTHQQQVSSVRLSLRDPGHPQPPLGPLHGQHGVPSARVALPTPEGLEKDTSPWSHAWGCAKRGAPGRRSGAGGALARSPGRPQPLTSRCLAANPGSFSEQACTSF